jgi:hypothetical protein
MCGADTTFRLTIKTGSALLNQQLRLNLTSGIQVTQATASAPASVIFPGFASFDSAFTIQINSLPAGDSVVIAYKVKAGCSVKIGNNSTFPGLISITSASLPSGSAGFTINKSSNGSITPLYNIHPSWSAALGFGSGQMTRNFGWVNSAPLVFSGYVRFFDQVSSGIQIDSIILQYTSGPSGAITKQTIANGQIIHLANIRQGDTIKVFETVKAITCINDSQILSNVLLSDGCTTTDLCNNYPFTITPLLQNVSPNIAVSSVTGWNTYFKCFGEDSLHTRTARFINTGNGLAKDFKMTFIPASYYYTDTSSLVIEIRGSNGRYITGQVSRDTTYDFVDCANGIYHPYSTCGTSSGTPYFDYYRNIVLPISQVPAFTNSYSDCGISQIMVSFIINKYRDAGGIHNIDLLPGDTITLSWQDRSCCPLFNVGGTGYPIIRTFYSDCHDNIIPSGYRQASSSNDVVQVFEAFKPLLNGNRDKCDFTRDGDIRDFSILNKNVYIDRSSRSIISDDTTEWGNFVVELKLDEGLDLDKSLNGTALIDTALTTCDSCVSSCVSSSQIWPVSDPNRYKIYITDPVSGVIWRPIDVTYKSDTALKNKTYLVTFNPRDLYKQVMATITDASLRNGLATRPSDLLMGVGSWKGSLNGSKITFSLRSFCTSKDKSYIQERLYYEPACHSGCKLGLTGTPNNIYAIVACPGCPVPGANVTDASLLRDTASLGFIDSNDDGVRDSNQKITDEGLRLTLTNGDILANQMTVVLSDGGSGGYQLSDIERKGIYLRYLYVNVSFGGNSPMIELLPGSKLEVSFDGSTWDTLSLANITQLPSGEYIFKIDAREALAPDSNFHHHRTIHIRNSFRIRKSFIGQVRIPVYVDYNARYSDYELPLRSWTFPGGDALSKRCDFLDPLDPCPEVIANQFYQCTAGIGLFNFTPSFFNTEKLIIADDGCKKLLQFKYATGTNFTNSFPFEYRPFMSQGQEVPYQFEIPSEYDLNSITIFSAYNQVARQGYTLTLSGNQIMDAHSAGLINLSNDSLSFSLNYQYITAINYDLSGTYTGQPISIYDENINTTIFLELIPKACSNIHEVIFSDSIKVVDTLSSFLPVFVRDPKVTLPEFPVTSPGTFTFKIKNENDKYLAVSPGVTNLTARSVSNAYVSNDSKYYIPVFFNNTALLDANGNKLKDFYGRDMQAIDAKHPFLFVSNLDSLASMGITIEGVYNGNVTNTTGLTNLYDPVSGFARLRNSGRDYIAKDASQLPFTVVANYDCGACSSVQVPECSSGQSEWPSCLKNDSMPKQIKLKYGWNCTSYPDIAADLAGECFVKDIDSILINTPPVGLSLTSRFIQDSLPVNIPGADIAFCTQFEYDLIITSCQDGRVNPPMAASVTIPLSLTYLSANASSVISGQTRTFNLDSLAGGDGLAKGDSIVLKIMLSYKGNVFNGERIKSSFNGISYCGVPVSSTKSDTLHPDEVLEYNKPPYCLNLAPVNITPTTLGGTFTSSCPAPGFVKNADSLSATFTPALAGVGVFALAYSIDTAGCLANFVVNVIDKPTANLTISGGGAGSLCLGQTLTLFSNPTGGQTPYTFLWTGGSTANSLAVSTAGNYEVIVSDSNSCSDSSSINLTSYSVTANAGRDTSICAGASVRIGADSTSGTSYLWQGTDLSSNTVSNPVATPTVSRTYVVTSTDRVSGCTGKDTVLVNVSPVPSISIMPQGNTVFCQGGSVILTATIVSGSGTVTSCQWMKNGTLLGVTTVNSYTATASGQYSAIVTTSFGCAITTAAVTVKVNPLPIKPIVNGPLQVCSGSTNKYAIATLTEMNINLISMSAGFTLNSTTTNSVTTVFNVKAGSQSGNLQFRRTNTLTGCTRDTNIFVNVTPLPEAIITANGLTDICPGDSAILSANTGTGLSYQWSKDGAAISGATSSNYSAKLPGSYTVTTKIGTCTATSPPVAITSSCCHSYAVTLSGQSPSSFINPVLGTFGTETEINAGGGTKIFNGTYHVKGNLRLKNGTFKITPGTIFYFDTESGVNLPLCKIGSTDYTTLIVDQATLSINGATLAPTCLVWGGIYSVNGSTVTTQSAVFGGTTRRTVIRDVDMGLISSSETCYTGTSRIYINNTDFYNAFSYGILELNKTSYLAGEQIINSKFYTSPAKAAGNNYGIGGIVFTGTSVTPDLTNLKIDNNQFDTLIIAMDINGSNMNITNNIIKNIYGFGLNIHGSGTISNNTFTVPSVFPFPTTPNYRVIGMNLTARGTSSNLMVSDNIIQGDNANPIANAMPQIGILSNSSPHTFLRDSIRSLDEGIVFNGVNYSTTIQSNNFRDNVKGISFRKNTYAALNSPVIRCNTMRKQNPFGGTTFGISVEQSAFINSLGTSALPNGNDFYGVTQQVRHDCGSGSICNTGFQYFRYIQEPVTIIFGSPAGTVPPPTQNANANTCPGTVGVLRVGYSSSASLADISEMKDSLKNKVGSFADLKYYQEKIVEHHVNNGTVQDLENYTQTLPGSNKEAYNSLGLYLMDHYRGQGSESKALAIRNAILAANPSNSEVSHRVKYFDVTGRMNGKTLLPYKGLDAEDSIALADIAGSGTSLAEAACVQLSLYYFNMGCQMVVSSDDTTGISDIPVKTSVAFLGNAVPNPSSAETMISYTIPANTQNASIAVYSMVQGKIEEYELDTAELQGELTINLSSYNNGMYIYTLIVDGNPVDNKKIIVIK